jgi:alanine racemase
VLNNSSSIKVKSIFSHLAASEDLNEKAFTETQIKHFDHISKKVISLIGYEPILHLLNTSGIFNYPESQYDMVRTGIGLYGFANDLEEDKQLKPIASLKTVISQLHTIQKGETIGYNRALTASHEMRTATLPLGHADGISRAYGNGKGWVIINGQKAAIVGNVCMDMLMVDVTNINCNQGDEVIVFGATPTAEELTAVVGTISYELLTAISQRVKRRVT